MITIMYLAALAFAIAMSALLAKWHLRTKMALQSAPVAKAAELSTPPSDTPLCEEEVEIDCTTSKNITSQEFENGAVIRCIDNVPFEGTSIDGKCIQIPSPRSDIQGYADALYRINYGRWPGEKMVDM